MRRHARLILFVTLFGEIELTSFACEPSYAQSTKQFRPDPNLIESFRAAPNGDFLLLPVTVQGHDYTFIVDTGSSLCIVDSRLRPLLRPTGHTARRARAGTEHQTFVFTDATIGNARTRLNCEVLCEDLSLLRSLSECDVHGILGMTFLRTQVLRIDFDEGMVSFLRKAADNANRPMQLSFDDLGTPRLDATIGTDRAVPMLLDTGMLGLFTVGLNSETFKDAVSHGQVRQTGTDRTMTFGGERIVPTGLLPELRVGDFVHSVKRVTEADNNSLGLEYLSRYQVTFDFPASRIYLQEGKRFADPLRFNRSGLAIRRSDGATTVQSASEGSPSFSAGLRVGDIITEINGERVDQFSVFEIRRRVADEGTKLRIAVSRGGEQAVVVLTIPETTPRTAGPIDYRRPPIAERAVLDSGPKGRIKERDGLLKKR